MQHTRKDSLRTSVLDCFSSFYEFLRLSQEFLLVAPQVFLEGAPLDFEINLFAARRCQLHSSSCRSNYNDLYSYN